MTGRGDEPRTNYITAAGIKRLQAMDGSVFVALTNNEGVVDAMRKAKHTHVGVMDSRGGIVKQSEPPYEADPA